MTTDQQPQQTWQKEILARHRWGQHGPEQAESAISSLQSLWDAIQPIQEKTRGIIDQIVALEICNWNLESSILALCAAVGSHRPTSLPIGHMRSISDERWREVWAYYLSLKQWLPRQGPSGYAALLSVVDSESKIQQHIRNMLGERDDLKELYVERFCLCLESFLDGSFGDMSASRKALDASIPALDNQIQELDPDSQILKRMTHGTGGARLFPCSHKLCRRYDIIISSIGCGKWRGVLPQRGTDGFERADCLASYLDPIEAWLANGKTTECNGSPATQIVSSLGEPDDAKRFLASLLVSLLRAQELAARKRAQQRAAKPNK